MTGTEFAAQVLAAMPRATAKEREAVRRELADHMADRAEGLLELGLDQEAAEERAAAAMGDPAEIGRALNRQLSPFWLWLGRAAAVLLAAVCMQAALDFDLVTKIGEGLGVRYWPERELDVGLENVEAETPLDLRAEMGNDVLRVFRVAVGGDGEGSRMAEVSMCAYDRSFFGMVSSQSFEQVQVSGERGDVKGPYNGWRSTWVSYGWACIPISEAETSLLLEYERFGERIELEIPLPETEQGGAP